MVLAFSVLCVWNSPVWADGLDAPNIPIVPQNDGFMPPAIPAVAPGQVYRQYDSGLTRVGDTLYGQSGLPMGTPISYVSAAGNLMPGVALYMRQGDNGTATSGNVASIDNPNVSVGTWQRNADTGNISYTFAQNPGGRNASDSILRTPAPTQVAAAPAQAPQAVAQQPASAATIPAVMPGQLYRQYDSGLTRVGDALYGPNGRLAGTVIPTVSAAGNLMPGVASYMRRGDDGTATSGNVASIDRPNVSVGTWQRNANTGNISYTFAQNPGGRNASDSILRTPAPTQVAAAPAQAQQVAGQQPALTPAAIIADPQAPAGRWFSNMSVPNRANTLSLIGSEDPAAAATLINRVLTDWPAQLGNVARALRMINVGNPQLARNILEKVGETIPNRADNLSQRAGVQWR